MKSKVVRIFCLVVCTLNLVYSLLLDIEKCHKEFLTVSETFGDCEIISVVEITKQVVVLKKQKLDSESKSWIVDFLKIVSVSSTKSATFSIKALHQVDFFVVKKS